MSKHHNHKKKYFMEKRFYTYTSAHDRVMACNKWIKWKNPHDMKHVSQISSKRLKCEMCQKVVKMAIKCKNPLITCRFWGHQNQRKLHCDITGKKKVLLFKMDTNS